MTNKAERVPYRVTSDGQYLYANRQPVADQGGNRAQRRLAAKAKRHRDKRQAKEVGK